MSAPHLLLMLLINLTWGLNTVIVKSFVDDIPPLLFAAMRFLVLFLVLLPFLKIHVRKMGAVLATAVTAGFLHFAFFFLSLAHAPASVISIATQMAVPFTTLMSVMLLSERVGWRRTLAILSAFVGILIIGFDPSMFGYLTGIGLALFGSFIYGFANVAMKRLKGISVFELQAWVAAVSAPALFILSAAFEPDSPRQIVDASAAEWGAVVFTALGASLLGHGGYYYLVQRYDVSIVMPATLLAPMFGILFSILFLGERLTAHLVVGGLFVFGGVFIITVRQSILARERRLPSLAPVPVAAPSAPTVPVASIAAPKEARP